MPSSASANACKIALVCVMGLLNSSHVICQQLGGLQPELRKAPEKKRNAIDRWYVASLPILSGATALDAFTTAHNLDHPTVASRADGSLLATYRCTEDGASRYFGGTGPVSASAENSLFNFGVTLLSRRLARRGGWWKVAAVTLNLAKAGANVNVTVQFQVFFFGEIADFLFLDFGGLIPRIFGKSTPFFITTSREVLPLRYLNGSSQSVNGLVRLRIIHAFSHRWAEVYFSNPLILFRRPWMCELNDSIRLLVLGHFAIR